MASLPYVADSVFASNVGETITASSPDDLRDGDVLYAILTCDMRPTLIAGGVTDPDEWTLLATVETTVGNDRKVWALRRVVFDAADEPASYSFDVSGTGTNYAWCLALIVVRGARVDWVRTNNAISDTVPASETGAYAAIDRATASTGANDFTPAAASGGEYTDQPFLALSWHSACMDTAVTGKTGGAPSGYTLLGYVEADGGGSGFNTFLEVATYAASDPTTLPTNVWTGTADDATSEYTLGYILIPPGVPHRSPGRTLPLFAVSFNTVTGVAAGASTASGTATGLRTVLGAGAGASTASGSATGTRTVYGVSAGASTASGSAAGARTVYGVAAGASTTSGTAIGEPSVPGTGAGSSSSSGTATGTRTVLGVAAGASTASGTASGTRTIYGTSAGASTASGTASGTRTVYGTSSGASTASGTASGYPGVDGTASGSATSSGSATGEAHHPGTGAGTVTSSGNASGRSYIPFTAPVDLTWPSFPIDERDPALARVIRDPSARRLAKLSGTGGPQGRQIVLYDSDSTVIVGQYPPTLYDADGNIVTLGQDRVTAVFFGGCDYEITATQRTTLQAAGYM